VSNRRDSPVGGSYPEEQYVRATRKNMHLDMPTSHGGWPEGEYDPPVADRLYSWYKKMGMMQEDDDQAEYIEQKEKSMRITESRLRRIIREEYSRMREADAPALDKTQASSLAKAFRSKKFKSEQEMQGEKKSFASGLAAAGANSEQEITDALSSAGYGEDADSFALELIDMQKGIKEGQRGNDQNSQHDNDTDPGDPYAAKLRESQRGNDENGQHDNDTEPGDPMAKKLKENRSMLRRAVLAEMRRQGFI
jgi:hypothetical protein